MPIDPAQLASASGGSPVPSGAGNVLATPQQAAVGDPQAVLTVLEDAIKQSVDANGNVDLKKLVAVWQIVAQKHGVQVPLQTVMQMIEQNPNLLLDIITRLGLNGIIKDGRV